MRDAVIVVASFVASFVGMQDPRCGVRDANRNPSRGACALGIARSRPPVFRSVDDRGRRERLTRGEGFTAAIPGPGTRSAERDSLDCARLRSCLDVNPGVRNTVHVHLFLHYGA